MSEKYSLASHDFKILEKQLEDFTDEFYSTKRRIHGDLGMKDGLELFRKDLKGNMRRFLHEYDMGCITRTRVDNNLYIKGELTTEWLHYILYVCKFLCSRSPGLKPAYTIQGKNAEGMFMFALNNFLHYFRVPTSLDFNKNSFVYGGDGGADFCLGNYRFDIKHRDDGPNHGLILGRSFLERLEDDIILVLCTNATNIKLGTSMTKHSEDLTFAEVTAAMQEQVFPLAITGWVTAKEFKEDAKLRSKSNDRYVMDDLHDISELFMAVVEDQVSSSRLFA